MPSKIGVHIQRRDESYMLGQHLGGHVVKIIDYPDYRNLWPDHLVIVREVVEQRFEDWCTQRGRAGAEAWWERVKPKYLTAQYATAVEILNEPWCGTIERCKQVAEFLQEAIRICADNGLQTCVLNIAEGNPPAESEEQWRDQVRVLLEGTVGAHLLGLHGYWLPASTTHRESGITPYHALPHVRWYKVADHYGIPAPSTVLTEAGCDGGVGYYRPGIGWTAFYKTFADYLIDIAAFDVELLKEPRLLGAALYTAGGTGMWQTFNLGRDELDQLNAYIEQQGGPWVPGAQPPPDPDPDPAPGDTVDEIVSRIRRDVDALAALARR